MSKFASELVKVSEPFALFQPQDDSFGDVIKFRARERLGTRLVISETASSLHSKITCVSGQASN